MGDGVDRLLEEEDDRLSVVDPDATLVRFLADCCESDFFKSPQAIPPFDCIAVGNGAVQGGDEGPVRRVGMNRERNLVKSQPHACRGCNQDLSSRLAVNCAERSNEREKSEWTNRAPAWRRVICVISVR